MWGKTGGGSVATTGGAAPSGGTPAVGKRTLVEQVASAGGVHSPTVQRRNTTATPSEIPGSLPPASVAPPASEPVLDAEGNQIAEDGGHWHLARPPKSLPFPIAVGYRYQLLPINPNAAYAALRERLVAIQAEQLAYAVSLKGDMKYWFAKVYYFVTTHELAAIDAGKYLYPHMKMEEVAQFHAAYKTNLDAWQAGNKDKVEAHWKKAFASAEKENGGTWYKPRSMELMAALLPSMEAHIHFDLPRALAACYVLHYAGIPGTSVNDFKSDFDAMSPVFDKAQASLLGDVKESTWTIDPGHYGGVQDLGFPFIFSVPQEREHTFEKASKLAAARGVGKSNKAFIADMRAETTGAHPFSGQADFDVDGTDVGDAFDWMHQPGARRDPVAPGPSYETALAPPAFPEKLYFLQGRGEGEDKLEQAIRDDQDLAPYKALAQWTRNVRDAEIYLEGHASLEGIEVENKNLASTRAFLVKHFMWHHGADDTNNRIVDAGKGTAGASATPEWRYVLVKLTRTGTGRQQHRTPNTNLPSEVAK
jgi:hypothetical protein